MLRVVLDSNVFVSALIDGRGALGAIIGAWRDMQIIVLTGRQQVDEIGHVLRRPAVKKRHGMSEEGIDEFLQELQLFSVQVEIDRVKQVIEDDPDDDFLLALAESGGADYIVSGDHHLLSLREYRGVRILSPGDFHRILEDAKRTE